MSFAQDIKTGRHVIVYNGNKFVLEPQNTKDTDTVVDPITSESKMVISDAPPFPVSMNRKHVYTNNEVEASSRSIAPNIPLEEEIIKNLKGVIHLESIPDGFLQMNIKQVIIDEDGKVVYSDFSDMRLAAKDNQVRSLAYGNPDKFFENITEVPATYKGQKVISSKRIFMNRYLIEIKDHALTYHKIW